MSNESRFVSESLQALLVSIADGVREAQEVMSSAPSMDAFGRPMTTYHLPHLDFKLEVNMETVAKTGGGGLLLKIRRAPAGSSTRDVSSTLSGRLVAIPPGEGLPIQILTITSKPETARRHRITVNAINSAGEILLGQAIELNINMAASKQLSAIEGVTLNSLRAGTRLRDVILITDESGTAETVLNIDGSLAAKAVLVVSAELGVENVNLSVAVAGGA